MEDDERVFDAPVGGVGDVRHARQGIERDVVPRRVARKHRQRAPAQRSGVDERALEATDRSIGGIEQTRDLVVARRIVVGVKQTPPIDFGKTVPQGFDEKPLSFRIFQKIVLQVRIAHDDPDIAQHLEEHPRGAAGAALAPKVLEQRPDVRAQQANDDLAIGKRRVVVRDFAQPWCIGVRFLGIGQAVGGGVHRAAQFSAPQHRAAARGVAAGRRS